MEKYRQFWQAYCHDLTKQSYQQDVSRRSSSNSTRRSSLNPLPSGMDTGPFGMLSTRPFGDFATTTGSKSGSQPRRGSVIDQLPCQFCRKVECVCQFGQAEMQHSPDHLKGSLWAVPPSIFSMFCRPVWVPHKSGELPPKWQVKEMEKVV